VSENRFLQSFCALVGAATLVCGTHLFLLATSDWDSPILVIEPPPATPAISIELSTGSSKPAGPITQLDVAPEAPVASPPSQPSETDDLTASTPDQPPTAAEAPVGGQTPLSPGDAVSTGPTTEEQAAASAANPVVQSPAPSETAELGAQSAGDNKADSAGPQRDAVSPQVASEDQAAISEPNPQGPSPQQAEVASPHQPVSDGIEETASILTAASDAKPEQPSPQVPLPQRAPRATKEKPAPKLAAKPDQREEQTSQATPRWKPMGLAPADKPSISLTQGQPKRPDAAGYRGKVWSALARHKPNAGMRGSATVTFAIGAGGALRFVRVSQSSGNARLDQLALATVRNAAPFPPPSALKDGTAAYTIRIDFH
jgi:periplasmic protein TonB